MILIRYRGVTGMYVILIIGAAAILSIAAVGIYAINVIERINKRRDLSDKSN
jgi:hypothetical protein